MSLLSLSSTFFRTPTLDRADKANWSFKDQKGQDAYLGSSYARGFFLYGVSAGCACLANLPAVDGAYVKM